MLTPNRLLLRCSLLGAVLGTVACARPAEQRPFVASLSLRGVRNVSRAKLERGLVSRPVPWWRRGQVHVFDELELARDRLRVERFYEQNGYFASKVVLAKAEPRPNEKGVDVVIAVEEGAPTYIGDVKVMGLADVDADTRAKAHKAQRGLRRGQVFHHADYDTYKGDLLTLLHRNGYPQAKVSGLVDVVPTQNLANITVTANPSGGDPAGTTSSPLPQGAASPNHEASR